MNKTKLFLSGVSSLIDSPGMENLLNGVLDNYEPKNQQTADEIKFALTKAEVKRLRKNEKRLYNGFKYNEKYSHYPENP